MTPEQKVKAYDEAIKKAAALYKASEPMSGCNVILETIFPELKESEDEKIRKEILQSIRDNMVVIHKDKCIAWIEKQEGCEYIKKDWLEHIKQSWYKEGFIDGKYSGGTSKEWTINDVAIFKEIIDFLENGTAKLQHDLTKYANWLKIQFTPIEKQGRQFSVDKLEPKFKVGDWVVQNDLGIYKIVEVCESWYEVISYNDGIQYSIGFDKENDCHLWTIQDAKDGDVLKEDSCIFILEKIKSQDTAITHCCLFDDGDFNLSSKICFDVDSTYPATKEQRDTLLKAMADAGYTFDFERKELKRIVQKPEENKGNIGGISANWSEEDDGMIRHCVAAIYAADYYDLDDKENMEKFLESIKQRIKKGE